MRYELSNDEWIAIKPMLPNKPCGVPRVNDGRALKRHVLDRALRLLVREGQQGNP